MPDSRSTNRSQQWKEAYPEALRKRERKLFKCRNRGKSDRVSEGDAQVGVALSGGGIRSATFAFGVIQAFAKRKALQEVDVLSTVSGGGYIGALISRLYSREEVKGPDDVARAILPPHHESDGGINHGVVWKWLKANGRYLAPARGSGDVLLAAAVAVRNWLTLHFVLGTLILALFLILHSLRSIQLPTLPVSTASTAWTGEVISFLLTAWDDWRTWCDSLGVGEYLRWSTWSLLPVLVAVYAAVVGLATWAFGGNVFSKRFQCFSRLFKKALVSFGIVLAVAVIDTIGRIIYDFACRHPWVCGDGWVVPSLGAVVTVVAVVASIRGLAIYLSNQFGTGWASLSLRLVAATAAGLLFTLELTAVNVLSHKVAWTLDYATKPMWATVVALLFICVLVGHRRAFLNRSSLWPLYTARLIRAYLGASNPKRVDLAKRENDLRTSVTHVVDGDDTSTNWRREALCGIKHGAPLHLVNVTINETLDGASGIQHNDRNGIGMAIGPVGISAGIRHHLVFKGACGCHAKVFPEVSGGQTRTGLPYRVFEYREGEDIRSSDKPSDWIARYRGEGLTLGQWTGISGAAFSTGMGSRTSLAASLLLGFFNVRLGSLLSGPIIEQIQLLMQHVLGGSVFGIEEPLV